MIDAIGSVVRSFVDLLFPARCLYCRRLGSPFCSACRAEAIIIGDVICVRCGAPTTERCTCSQCKRSPVGPLRGMRGAVFYGGPVAFAIHGLKYRGLTQLASPLASYLVTYVQNHALPVALLAPVPLHAERQAARGYNQSELLAHAMSKALAIPMRSDLITRARHTPPQVHLNRQQRLENVRGAFEPCGRDLLHGETVLLIDDVCTTGATFRASAEALRMAGAGDIWGLAIARARPKADVAPWQRGLTPAQAFIALDGEASRPGNRETRKPVDK